MVKTKVLIIILTVIILGAVLLGTFLAYYTYKSPMYVEDLEKAIETLTSTVKNETDRMTKLAIYNELLKSQVMIDRHTNERKKFTDKEMQQIYHNIGGKEAILKYLESIEDDGKRRNELILAFDLKIINRDEMDKMW